MHRAVPLAAAAALLLLSSLAQAGPVPRFPSGLHMEPEEMVVCASADDQVVPVTVEFDTVSTGPIELMFWGHDPWVVPPPSSTFIGPVDGRVIENFLVRGGAPVGLYLAGAQFDRSALAGSVEVRLCAPPFDRWRFLQIRDLWRVCLACQDLHVNDQGDLVARLRDRILHLRRDGVTTWLDEVVSERFEVRGLDEAGRVGLAVDGGSLVADLADEHPSITAHTGFAMTAMGHDGTLGGVVPGKGAALLGAHGLRLLPLGAADARVTAVSGLGWAVGTFVQGGAVRSFLFDGAQVTVLPDLGGGGVQALAISATGRVVGTARDGKGAWRAFAYTRRDGTRDLGVAGRAVSVDAVGNAVVVAGQGPAAPTFLVTGQGKVVPAGAVGSDVKVTSLVGFTASGTLVARAFVGGAEQFVLLVAESLQR